MLTSRVTLSGAGSGGARALLGRRGVIRANFVDRPSSLARIPARQTDLGKFGFMTGRPLSVAGHACFVTRSGYTGAHTRARLRAL